MRILKRFNNKSYLDLTDPKVVNGLRHVKLVKMPYKRLIIVLVAIIILISIITPFTNFFLIPLAIKILWRYG